VFVKSRRQLSRGFTLVEVVVAFAILAVSLGVFYQVVGSNLRRSSEVGRYQVAVMTAQSLLSEASTATLLQDDVMSGRTRDDMTWDRSVEPYDFGRPFDSDLRPFLVTVRVRWGTRQSQMTRLEAIVLGKVARP
jgi:general secretion pathway protein I